MMPYTVKAEYRNQIIPEYQGNPLIEALPDIWSTEHVIGMLSDKAAYNNGERKLDIQYRLHCLPILFRYVQPLYQHSPVYNRLYWSLGQS